MDQKAIENSSEIDPKINQKLVHPATVFIFMRQVLKSGTVFHNLGTIRTSKALVEVTPVFPDVGELLIL